MMTTFETLMVTFTFALLIVGLLTYINNHKK